jgi:hypothetical protein
MPDKTTPPIEPGFAAPAGAKRKRGGQPGNHNALKHGFYSKSFSHLEERDLEAIHPLDLSDEIAMLRVSLRRFFDVITGVTDPDDARQVLAILGQSASRLAGLLKAQKLLQDPGNVDVASSLSEALKDVVDEFRLD